MWSNGGVFLWVPFSALTLLVGQQEGHQVGRKPATLAADVL